MGDSFDDIFGSIETTKYTKKAAGKTTDDIFSFDDQPDDGLLDFVNDAMEAEASTYPFFPCF